MGQNSNIEWPTHTWSPFRARTTDDDHVARVGRHCSKVSDGCRNCYAEGINRRLGTGFDFKPEHLVKDIAPFLDERILVQPLGWRRGGYVFVNSMTDTFGEWVPDAWLDALFAVMMLTPHMSYQVLTKRPKRMRDYVRNLVNTGRWLGWKHPVHGHDIFDPVQARWDVMAANIWFGVSAENQPTLDDRLPYLLDTPAAVRFVSAEPLLGPQDYTRVSPNGIQQINAIEGWSRDPEIHAWLMLDWIIIGGESGPGARDFHLEWLEAIVSQCAGAHTAVFVKQVGARPMLAGRRLKISDRKGGELSEWPEAIRVRQMPGSARYATATQSHATAR